MKRRMERIIYWIRKREKEEILAMLIAILASGMEAITVFMEVSQAESWIMSCYDALVIFVVNVPIVYIVVSLIIIVVEAIVVSIFPNIIKK